MLVALVLAVALVDKDPTAADSDLPHLAVAVGPGLAYSYVGAHVEVRWKTIVVFLSGTPFPALGANRPLSEHASLFGAGVRIAPEGGGGWFVSAQATWCRFYYHLD